METQGVPFDSLRLLRSAFSETSHVLRRENLLETQDSPLGGEDRKQKKNSRREGSTHMETQGVPFDSLRLLRSAFSETSHVLRRENLLETQDSPLGGEENGNERKRETAEQDTFQTNGHASNETSHYTQDKVKRKGPDFSLFTTDAHHSALDNSSAGKNALMEIKASNAVAFHIPTEQSVCRPPPKRFCDQVKSERENISIERLTEKQKMAEKRKKQHVEQRLKRIHDRQEAARKLAHNVELLLQQKSLIGHGGGINHNTPRMTSSELMTTARHVAKDFRTLTCQMTKDFSVDDKNNNLSKECQRQVMPTHQKEKPTSLAKSSSNDNNRSVAFTVGFDEDKQPVSPIPKALQVPCRKDKSKLTAQELDEKLRKAAERRNHRQQERVKQVRANREALFKLASDLERFMIWNDTEKSEGQQQHQARQLANDIADGFDRLSQRYSRDLKRAEGFSSILWESKQL